MTPDQLIGTLIIPAYNEEASIGRTLQSLSFLRESPQTEVIVVCNGCTDGTAAIARSATGVRVLEIEHASKIKALNAGDASAKYWPRIYLDADVVLAPVTVADMLTSLDERYLAARPPIEFDADNATNLVRRFYRARTRLMTSQCGLWGAGIYGLSRAARERFHTFPDVTADDLWVDSIFSRREKAVLNTVAATVTAPCTLSGLVAILRRTYRGNRQIRALVKHDMKARRLSESAKEMLREIDSQQRTADSLNRWIHSFADVAKSTRNINEALDSLVYFTMVLLGRFLAVLARRDVAWERDESSRRSKNEVPFP